MASCWENVKSVLVDDFAGIGTEQILIFFKSDSISETLKAFQITDFGNFNYEVRYATNNWEMFILKRIMPIITLMFNVFIYLI